MKQDTSESLTTSIVAAFERGDIKTGCALFQSAGGDLFVFRHGYDELGRVIAAMPKGLWRKHEFLLGAYILLLAKRGRARRAQALLRDPDIGFEKTSKLDIYQLWLAIHLGDPVGSAQLDNWLLIESRLPIAEPLLEGLYYNCILVFLVRHGRLKEARTVGQRAIAAYRDAQHVYLEHFIHLHFADLSMMEGRLKDARRSLNTGIERLRQSGLLYRNEHQVIEVLLLTLDYETGQIDHIPSRAIALRDALIEGDSWVEIFEQLARVTVKSVYFLSGRSAALAELELFRAGYARRHGGMSEVLALLEVAIDRLDLRTGDAKIALVQLDLERLRSPIGQALLKEVGAPAGSLQNGTLELTGPRYNIVARLKAAEGEAEHQRRRLVEQALWSAVKEGHLAPFLEHRDVFSGLGSGLSTGRFARGHLQLARMARRAVKMIAKSYWVPQSMRALGVTRHQFRIVSALQSGATNKEIARSLAISEATVKYHLAALYRRLNVHRRGELLELVYKNQLIDEN